MIVIAGAALAQDTERGRWDSEVAFDVLHASSQATGAGVGPEETLSATELGMRVRGNVESGAVAVALDYQGREAVAGLFPNFTTRVLYRAEVVGTVAADRLALGAGRFLAPSVGFLPVDGARVDWRPAPAFSFQAFGGRRGVDTSMRSVDLGTFLPAIGGSGAWRSDRGSAEVVVSWAGDRLSGASVDPEADGTEDTWTSLAATARGHVEPVDDLLIVGATATASQRASYVFLPQPGVGVVTAEAMDLFQGLAYARWRPTRAVRADLDLLRQETNLAFVGVDDDPEAPGLQLPSGLDLALVDPTFTDLRARGALAAGSHVWIRPDARLRLRTGRAELRYGLGADLNDLGLDGPFVRARAWLEDIRMGGTADDVGPVDRLLWQGSAGWSSGPVDAEIGASRVDRSAAPVTARTNGATASEDLGPFVLEAQDIAFARLFVTDRSRWGGWFGGLDGEMNVSDVPEVRAFVQVGFLGDGSW